MVVSGVGLGAVSSGDASGVGWELGVGVGVAANWVCVVP